MSQLRVYGFTDDAGRMVIEASGKQLGGEAVGIISNNHLHAIVGPEPMLWPWQDLSHFTLQRLMAYHRVLGDAATLVRKIVPAAFESTFDTASSIHFALQQHQRDIGDLLGRYGEMRQLSLSITWDMAAMQRLMARYPKVQTALETERKNLRDQALMAMQGSLQDIIILESRDEDMVLQAIMLVHSKDEQRLTQTLQRLDSECHGRLAMRLVGPLPACNFARVELKLPDQDIVREAKRELGIGNVVRMADVKSAYRAKVKTLHPDRASNNKVGGDTHDVMVRLTQSYKYLTRLAAQQNNGSENNPDAQWLRCDTKNLRQTPLMRVQRGMTRWDDALMKRH